MEPLRAPRDDEEPEVKIERTWLTAGERGAVLAGEGWRYTPRGKTRHATAASEHVRASACAIVSGDNGVYWRGTGTQEEYEHLAELRPCRNCVAVIQHGAELLAKAEGELP